METCAAFLNCKRPDLAISMADQLRGSRFAFYCFDNGGGLRETYARHRLAIFSRPDNIYFAGGWNWAMSELRDYDLVWMLNDDLEGVSQEMLSTLVKAMKKLPEAAAITPAFNSPHAIFRRRNEDGLRQVRWIDWTCPLVRMEAWETVGGFDTTVDGYGADIDWCYRAGQRGWEFYVHDGLEIHHLGSQTVMSQDTAGKMSDVARMNRFLREKWGVRDWTELT